MLPRALQRSNIPTPRAHELASMTEVIQTGAEARQREEKDEDVNEEEAT